MTHLVSRTRIRRTIALISTSVVLASAMATGSALAATPAWTMAVTPLPGAVRPGELAGYSVTITNPGPSNIAQVYLVNALETNDTHVPASPAVILATAFVSPSQGTCDPAGQILKCSLGAIRSGASATLTVAYGTDASWTSPLQVIFEANTTGATSSDGPGASHGDVLQGVGTTNLNADTNFGGRFVLTGNETVGTDTSVSPTNRQATVVVSPRVGVGVTVADGNQAGPLNCPTTCWSETSEIHIGDGTGFYPGGFTVVITLYRPPTINGVYHEFDQPHFDAANNPVLGEVIPACPRRGTQLPCFTKSNLPGGNVQVTVLLLENGKVGNF